MTGSQGRFIGITRQEDSFALVTIAPGATIGGACFPASAMSAEAIRIYLGDHDGPVGVAVDSAMIEHALRWGRTTFATTTLVPSGTPTAERLARYARHAP